MNYPENIPPDPPSCPFCGEALTPVEGWLVCEYCGWAA